MLAEIETVEVAVNSQVVPSAEGIPATPPAEIDVRRENLQTWGRWPVCIILSRLLLDSCLIVHLSFAEREYSSDSGLLVAYLILVSRPKLENSTCSIEMVGD